MEDEMYMRIHAVPDDEFATCEANCDYKTQLALLCSWASADRKNLLMLIATTTQTIGAMTDDKLRKILKRYIPVEIDAAALRIKKYKEKNNADDGRDH